MDVCWSIMPGGDDAPPLDLAKGSLLSRFDESFRVAITRHGSLNAALKVLRYSSSAAINKLLSHPLFDPSPELVSRAIESKVSEAVVSQVLNHAMSRVVQENAARSINLRARHHRYRSIQQQLAPFVQQQSPAFRRLTFD